MAVKKVCLDCGEEVEVEKSDVACPKCGGQIVDKEEFDKKR